MVVFPTIVFSTQTLHFSYESRVKFEEIGRDWKEVGRGWIACAACARRGWARPKVALLGGFRRNGVVYPLTGRLLSLQNK